MKITVLLIFFLSLGILSAELEINIPFDPDMIGPSYETTGDYTFDSEWITITNIGATAETYNLTWSYSDLPQGWLITVCNDLFLCYIPNMPAPVNLDAGESIQVHIEIGVNSTGGCGINITLNDGDLTEPISTDFTFNTEDNVSADEILNAAKIYASNYPNPFNPNTTISFSAISPEQTENIELVIYNNKGQKVKRFNTFLKRSSGTYEVIWNGSDESGKIVSAGIYYYQINYGEKTLINKMLLLK
ncbi:MAG: hypothetical protein APR54_02975 [Candidatus Cloacimonas sp. SDB]|nr:MAG: hypothetical protein APR54_02975 [Candidatus Cloacimonas sp. SDB]